MLRYWVEWARREYLKHQASSFTVAPYTVHVDHQLGYSYGRQSTTKYLIFLWLGRNEDILFYKSIADPERSPKWLWECETAMLAYPPGHKPIFSEICCWASSVVQQEYDDMEVAGKAANQCKAYVWLPDMHEICRICAEIDMLPHLNIIKELVK